MRWVHTLGLGPLLIQEKCEPHLCNVMLKF